MLVLRLLLLHALARSSHAAKLDGMKVQVEETRAPSHQTDFSVFVDFHGRDFGSAGSAEYEERHAFFEHTLTRVRVQNDRYNAGESSWRAGVNRLADRHPDELRRLRGYKMGVRPGGSGAGGAAAQAPLEFLGKTAKRVGFASVPEEWTWKDRLTITKNLQDQGACGSCWAVAAASVLRAHSELYQEDRTWSAQQIVACTMNPKNCGGKGGCDGATAELAFDYCLRTGCRTAEDEPYQSGTSEDAGRCPTDEQSHQMFFGDEENKTSVLAMSSTSVLATTSSAAASAAMTGWRRIPENKLELVMLGLVQDGPAVVSVHAGEEWNLYSTGILDNCPKDVVIDHAVMLIGFGTSPLKWKKYWQIQNSWGSDWGENGFVRIIRRDNEQEAKHCGWNSDPQMGSGCDGGPSKTWICGSCGILYDVVQPTFQLGPKGLLSLMNAPAKRM